MYRTRYLVFIFAAMFVLPLILGCSEDEPSFDPGPVGNLYRDCFEGNEDCLDYKYEILMHLVAVNGPNPDYSYPYLGLAGERGAGGLYDRISFDYYEYDQLPEDCGYPGVDQFGWKVLVPEAYVEICTTCYWGDGLAQIISLNGPRDLVEFIWDPEDTVAVRVSRSVIE